MYIDMCVYEYTGVYLYVYTYTQKHFCLCIYTYMHSMLNNILTFWTC